METHLQDSFEPFLDNDSYSVEDSIQIMSSSEAVAAPKKRALNRLSNFSMEEDKNLVSAWLNTSIDAVASTDQKAKTFWGRISITHNAVRGPTHANRTERSFSSRWGAIQLAVNKFCDFLTQVEDSRPSGSTEIDKIQMAKEMYHEMTNSHFQFDHCWNLLRHQPKWNMHMGQTSSKRKHVGSSTNKNQDAINLEDDNSASFSVEEIERPLGRTAEKERRKKGKSNHKDLAEVIGQLTLDKKKEHEERMVMAEVDRKRAEKEWQDHLAIESEKLQDEKQRVEAKRQRTLALVEKVEQQRRERDFQIMMTDLNHLSELQRGYMQSLQAEILAKRQM